MSSRLVSVIVPVYNGSEWIKNCLNSVLTQTHNNIELIVVDDDSQDGSVDIVKSINDDRITILQNSSNQGIATSRNRGIKESNGEYICFLDQDDIMLPDKIENQVKLFEKSSCNLGVVYGDVIVNDTANGENHILKSKVVPNERDQRIDEIYWSNPIRTISAMVKSSCFQRYGLLDESLSRADDYEFWLRIADDYEFCYNAKIYALKRSHQSNASGDISEMTRDRLKIANMYSDKYNLTEVHLSSKKSEIYLNSSKRYLDQRNYSQFLCHMWKSYINCKLMSVKKIIENVI